jgi:hypothetical protein
MALPEATERQSHGAPGFFAGRQFVMLWPEGHHDHRFPHLWCAAPPGVQAELLETEPDRFFRPPYVGNRGWIGVRLDGDVDWEEIREICAEAFRAVAPRRLVAALDAAARPGERRARDNHGPDASGARTVDGAPGSVVESGGRSR